jgi:hypothetical protein
MAQEIHSVEDGQRLIWPLLADAFAHLWAGFRGRVSASAKTPVITAGGGGKLASIGGVVSTDGRNSSESKTTCSITRSGGTSASRQA